MNDLIAKYPGKELDVVLDNHRFRQSMRLPSSPFPETISFVEHIGRSLSPVQRSAALEPGNLFSRIALPAASWESSQVMEDNVYFEFLAVLQGEGPTHFLIEVDKYDSVTGKESEDPELRAEDFIYLQHLAGVLRSEGPTRIFKDYVEKLHKVKLVATHRDGKVWTVQKPWCSFFSIRSRPFVDDAFPWDPHQSTCEQATTDSLLRACGTVFASTQMCDGWEIEGTKKHENVDSIIRDSRANGIGNRRGVYKVHYSIHGSGKDIIINADSSDDARHKVQDMFPDAVVTGVRKAHWNWCPTSQNTIRVARNPTLSGSAKAAKIVQNCFNF
jgi:hypothetical protein